MVEIGQVGLEDEFKMWIKVQRHVRDECMIMHAEMLTWALSSEA